MDCLVKESRRTKNSKTTSKSRNERLRNKERRQRTQMGTRSGGEQREASSSNVTTPSHGKGIFSPNSSKTGNETGTEGSTPSSRRTANQLWGTALSAIARHRTAAAERWRAQQTQGTNEFNDSGYEDLMDETSSEEESSDSSVVSAGSEKNDAMEAIEIKKKKMRTGRRNKNRTQS